MNIYVTGPIGSDRKGLAARLAEELSMNYLDMDSEIEKRDGRSIKRICMMTGEHEYRNQEYKLLTEIMDSGGYVCACSDAILLDPMCADILSAGRIVIAGSKSSPEELWQAAEADADIPYAFMADPDPGIRKAQFMKLYELRKNIYRKYEEAE